MKTPVHLNALRAFEASARHRSFALAAQELHVTPAAVGQLVRTLEDWLGMPLFLRNHRGRARLVPTEAAEQALPDIRAGLVQMAQGLRRLQAQSARRTLTVTVSPAFAAQWLLPRLDRFQTAWPETDVRLETSLKPVDFVAQQVDIGVRYGAGVWPGLVAERLLGEEVYPVCAPALLARARPLDSPADLLEQTLIHDLSMEGHPGFPSWADWLRQAGLDHAAGRRAIQINNSAAVLQAAAEGQGIALARSVMARDDLQAGRLVRLCPQIRLPSRLAYHVVYRPECAGQPMIQAFRDWLLAEAAAWQAAAAPALEPPQEPTP